MADIADLDAIAQADLVRRGDVSPAELVDAAIDRIESVNPDLNAVIHERFDKARGEAAGDLPDGPFRGVPMVVKDLICHTAGDPFHEGIAGVRRALGWVEQEDTELARRFKAAGFVIVGKTNTPELGILPTTEPLAAGASRNPWDTSRSTGGSSGGSGAAVAAGMVAVGHANDGGGSIRIPASACGLVGLKPSRGRVSLGSEFGDVMGGLVCELAVTRTVRDTAAVLDAVHGPAAGEPYFAPAPTGPYSDDVGADPGRLRIGLLVTAEAAGVEVHHDCVVAAAEAGRLLESLGHVVWPTTRPRWTTRHSSGTSSRSGRQAMRGPSTGGAGDSAARSDLTTSSRSHGRWSRWVGRRAHPTGWRLGSGSRRRAGACSSGGRGASICCSLRPWPSRLHRWARSTAHLTTRSPGCSAPPRSSPSLLRPTSRASPPSPCRCTGPTTACPSVSSWWRPPAGRTSCSRLLPNSSRQLRGSTAARRSTPEEADAVRQSDGVEFPVVELGGKLCPT